jgi:hypothetical protein
MNPAYQNIIAASADDQRGLFLAAANRVGRKSCIADREE